MGYLHAYSLRFILTWCESYIPASCLAYVQLDILGKRTGEHQASQCVRKTFRMSAGVIAVARETHQSESRNTGAPRVQGPVTIAASNLGVLISTPCMHTKGSRKLDVLFPANLLLGLQVSLPFVAVFRASVES